MSTQLTDQKSVRKILREMTLEEKARILSGASSFGTAAIPRLGIPAAVLLDGGSGVNFRQYLSNLLTGKMLQNDGVVSRYGGATGNGILSELVYIMDHIGNPEELDEQEKELLEDFLRYVKEHTGVEESPSAMPVNTLLAATWNPELAHECGKTIGREASALGIDVLLGTPCVNIQRDVLGGRGFEGYSEDPYLVSKMAPCYMLGVKESGVLTDVKHFAANNQETNRKTIDETISERALHEIYFPAFKACVQEGKADTVMTAYNWINGEACAHNRWLLEEILRGQWGFRGLVVSDWGGVYDRVKAIQAGNDLTMPITEYQSLIEAVQDGVLSEEELDRCVENYLNALVEMPVMKGRKYESLDSKAAARTAYQTAGEGMVLLKNENSALPLSKGSRIMLAGELGRWKETGVGSGRVHTDKSSNLGERLKRILGEENVLLGESEEVCDTLVLIVTAAGQEGMDRSEMRLDRTQERLLERMIAKARRDYSHIVLVMNVAGPIDLAEYIADIDAVLCVYFPGQEGGNAAGDILCGKINPSGKLPHTFPRRYEDSPSFGNFPGENRKVMYGEGIFVGYRYYDIRGIQPMFPFGYGLSYTNFQISDLKLRKSFVDVDRENVELSVRVKNVGEMEGKEVVQLYIHDISSTLLKPKKELKGFSKVNLNVGEEKEVTFTLKKEDLSSYDSNLHQWVCEPGEFEILIGNSSQNIILREIVNVTCKNPYQYGADTDYRTLIEDDRALDIIHRNLPQGSFTKAELRRGVQVYYPQLVSLREAFPAYIGVRLKTLQKEEQQKILYTITEELEQLESAAQMKYREKEIY